MLRTRWRLVLLVVVSVVVLGAGGFLAFRRIEGLQTVPGTENASAFALVGNRGYVLVQGEDDAMDYEVRAVDLTNGTHAQLARGTGDGRAIAADNRHVVWSVCNELGRMPCSGRTMVMSLAGGGPRVLLDKVATSIAMGGTRAYLVADAKLWVAELERAQTRVVASGDVRDVVTDERYVYSLSAHLLRRELLGGGGDQVLASTLPDATHMALGATGVLVSSKGPSLSDEGEVCHVPFDGSTPTVLAKGLRNPERPMPWGSWVAFIHAVPDAQDRSLATLTLSVVPSAGGPLKTVRDRFSGELVGDGSRLFVVLYDRVIRLPHE